MDQQTVPIELLQRTGLAETQTQVEEFCRRWKISALELFGSALREEFDDKSDVDLLVSFEPDSQWSLLDLIAMEDALAEIVGRPVDLVTRRSVERSRNWRRRREILGSARILYAA